MAQTVLDFDKPLSELPPSHTWPLSYIQNHSYDSTDDIPIIDMAKPRNLYEIRNTCEHWGIFTIINHGVSNKLMEDFKTEIERLFSLPTQVKQRVPRSPHEPSGYGGLPIERVFPHKMWHEGFGIRKSLHEHANKLWPPHGNPNFCQVMEDYQNALKMLAEEVLTLMLASVGLVPNDTNWAEPKTQESPFGPHENLFQLNSYPPCPDPNLAMGLTQHTDSSIVTVLNQVNNANGLQVLHEDMWVNVKPIPGSFVINCGDLAQFFFNGRFASPVHRVVLSQMTHRYSAAYFYGPPFTASVAPSPKLMDPFRIPSYHASRRRATTWSSATSYNHVFI